MIHHNRLVGKKLSSRLPFDALTLFQEAAASCGSPVDAAALLLLCSIMWRQHRQFTQRLPTKHSQDVTYQFGQLEHEGLKIHRSGLDSVKAQLS